MCQTARDYTENLKFIDLITNKVLKKETSTLHNHRKTISQPQFTEHHKLPDRFDQQLPFSVNLQLYPIVFKYIRIKVKGTPKPLLFHYESSNGTAQIKIFISVTSNSPNILNNNMQIVNRPRFQFSEPPAEVTRFQSDFVYFSIYSDKYTEIKLRVQAGIIALPKVMPRPQKKDNFFLEAAQTGRTDPSGTNCIIHSQEQIKTRSQNSFIRLNKESQVKFKLIQDQRIKTKRKISQSKAEEILRKKKTIELSRHRYFMQSTYSHEISRLQSRVNRLSNELQDQVNLLESEWFEIIYVTLIGKVIRQMYFKRVRRIIVLNKVQVVCRKFMRIMKSKLSYNYRRTLHRDCNLSLYIAAKQLKKKTKVRAKQILYNFLFIYAYQSDGMKKVQLFQRKIMTIQQKWKHYKNVESTYIQKSTYLFQQKWYQIFKLLQQEHGIQRQAPHIDKMLVLSVFRKHLDLYKKHFSQSVKLMESLHFAQNISVFRPMTNILMKELMQLYLDVLDKNK